ncbi:cysteine hydrolase [Enterococcus cecorum]|nr:cysteine hydrolase [Enterococcus cecorum]CAI3370595.1 cysteine hydrolase [Enterococcus cecorum]
MEGFEPHPGEKVFQKHVNSAFIGTNLEEYLHEEGIYRLVITGLTLPHCVSTTTRMAGNLGFETTLISDATATFALKDILDNWIDAEELHQSHLAALNEEFAKVMSCEEFLRVIDKKENEID